MSLRSKYDPEAESVQGRAAVFNKYGIDIVIHKEIKHPEACYKPDTIPEIIQEKIAPIMVFVFGAAFTPCILGKTP